MNHQRVCFLLGSGASVPAGFPTVAEITEKIAAGCGQEGGLRTLPDPLPDGGRNLLRWLEIQIKRRYVSEGDRAVHYENLYFLAKQLSDDLLDEYDNPAIRPFIEGAVEQVLPQLPSLPGNAYNELQKLAEDVTKRIRRTVVLLLSSHKPTRLDHLHFIVEAVQETGHPKPAILILNHDTLLETVLGSKDLDFVDGFAKEPNPVGVREWQPGQLVHQTDAIRVLKLHGGIDWYRLRPHGVQTHLEDYFGIPTSKCSTAVVDSQGRAHDLMDDSMPIFMIGSWDKLARYTDSVYLEIYYAAFEALRTSELLVVVGYGFGDKGINKLVTDWMCRSLKHRLLVVDRSALSLHQRARGAIAGKWQAWLDEHRLLPLKANLEESKMPWSYIKESLS